jgi:DNA-binding NtrC family response regulator
MSTRILIVDDEERVLFVLSRALTALDDGCLILTVRSGQQALEAMEHAPVDLVITDLIMPDLDGVHLTQEMRSLAPETPVIWITACGCRSFEADAERLGVYSCVEKPLEIHQIRTLVREALAGHSHNRSTQDDVRKRKAGSTASSSSQSGC